MSGTPAAAGPERPVGLVRGTRDWLPEAYAPWLGLEATLLDRFAKAGYAPLRTPILEFTELHERKSGAGIVAKLYELAGSPQGRLCLRPELTASVVRAYAEAAEPPPLPWRLAMSGPVFRQEPAPGAGHQREFHQVGVELLGASGPAADGEVIWLADWALRASGIADARLRIGHVGLILEMLERSGLPAAVRAALIERLSEAAAEGRDVGALELGLEQLSGWLGAEGVEDVPPPVQADDGGGVERLFRQLVPDVTGRRSGHEILERLRRKWELGHTLHDVLGRVRDRVHELAGLRGPAAGVLERLERDFRAMAPESLASLRELVEVLEVYGIARERIELDLGFGRGIGFYTQMVFEWVAATPNGPVEVCGGGRYDGLARVLGSDRDDRGVGFAIGLERLLAVLEARGASPAPAAGPIRTDLVVPERPELVPEAIRLALRLRASGQPVLLDWSRSPEEARAHATRLGLGRLLVVAGPADRPESTRVHVLLPGRGAP